MRGLAINVALALAVLGPRPARAVEPLPRQLRGVTVEERLGQRADLAAQLTDHRGRPLKLGDLLDGRRPVLLTLNYYGCANLCSLQLNALARALRGLEWAPGEGYRVVTLSIDPREGAELARKKRALYLADLGRGEVEWSFLVGKQAMIRRVADSVGFGFRYDAEQDQYAHPAVLIFLSPGGKVTRYLYGIEYVPRDLRFALIEASQGRVGSTVDKLILSCFHYDATSGRYGPWALGIMRVVGVVTALVLGTLLLLLRLRERRGRSDAGGPAQRQEAP